jgi:hypothetical protein
LPFKDNVWDLKMKSSLFHNFSFGKSNGQKQKVCRRKEPHDFRPRTRVAKGETTHPGEVWQMHKRLLE